MKSSKAAIASVPRAPRQGRFAWIATLAVATFFALAPRAPFAQTASATPRPSVAPPAATAAPTAGPAAVAPTLPTGYEVTDVRVDVTAENAAAAREKALADGAKLAAQQLFMQLLGPGKASQAPKLSQRQIEDMISDFSISGEKTSPVRYIATLSYRFRPSQVNRILRRAGVAVTLPDEPGAVAALPPTVVFPTLETPPGASDAAAVAETWRRAWRSFAQRNASKYVAASTGADIGDRAKILSAARSQGGGDALLVAAAVTNAAPPAAGGSPEPQEVTVKFRRIGPRLEAPGEVAFSREGSEPLDAFFARAAAGSAVAAAAAWKQASVKAAPKREIISVLVPADDLETWVDVQKRIRRAPPVKRLTLAMLERGRIVVDVDYVGSLQELSDALEDVSLALQQQDDGRWLVTPAADAPENVETVTP